MRHKIDYDITKNLGEPKYGTPEYTTWSKNRDNLFKKHQYYKKYMNYHYTYKELNEILYNLKDKANKADAEAFVKENKNKKVYRFNYEDSTTLGSIMEHSGIFNNLEHLRFSHH